ncbi:hypothetical protein BpHYR1_028552 [Brachionus plicatilis]|uniref:Uncharacterized protein n=1 Tax=Brachionus plicatilis TaxID=10195 RepID=A0A3M7Q4R5_BRAPC|nr:hypothetical protein BpHYR1_028552 [Brachionus plicatilis]
MPARLSAKISATLYLSLIDLFSTVRVIDSTLDLFPFSRTCWGRVTIGLFLLVIENKTLESESALLMVFVKSLTSWFSASLFEIRLGSTFLEESSVLNFCQSTFETALIVCSN